MLGKPYFDLARAIYRTTTFPDLVDLLVAKLPDLIGADEAVVLTKSPLRGYSEVSNHGVLAKRLGERLEAINRLISEHPVQKRIDFDNPGDLGFATSDYTSPAEYRESTFVQEVFGELAMNDVLFGALVMGKRRKAYVHCYLSTRTFAFQARERFDAILLTTRGVLDRLEANNVEASVRQRIFLGRAESPVAIFIAKASGEIFPLNFSAVSAAETWWGADEPSFQLTDERVAELDRELDDAWENAVTARWKEVKLNLGGGDMQIQALPKLSGETILLFQAGNAPVGDEALAILTRRQREIMEWIAEGKTSAEAAIILGISPRTVEKHLEAVFQRLGVENRIAAMRRYLDLKRGV